MLSALEPAQAEAPNLNHAIETTLRARCVSLTEQHRDLDSTVVALSDLDSCDELLLRRLKKRRLRLRDEIARIAGLLPA